MGMNKYGAGKRESLILLTSTSEVYGDPEVHPQPEEYRGSVNPIGIRSCYDEGKRIAETLALTITGKMMWTFGCPNFQHLWPSDVGK